jgi:hypothetical protein
MEYELGDKSSIKRMELLLERMRHEGAYPYALRYHVSSAGRPSLRSYCSAKWYHDNGTDPISFTVLFSEERETGYIRGYDDCEEEYLKEKNELSNFKIWPADKKRKYLCDLFGLNYYDIDGLKNGLKTIFE